MTALQAHLKEIDACREAIDWVGERTAAEMWAECKRADWMLWWLSLDLREHLPAIVLLLAEQIRARTLARVKPECREACERGLTAAETWANHPTEAHRLAARNAALDAETVFWAARDQSVEANLAVNDPAWAATEVAWAVTGVPAWISAVATSAGLAAGEAADAEHAAWCAAIRARWPEPPWKES